MDERLKKVKQKLDYLEKKRKHIMFFQEILVLIALFTVITFVILSKIKVISASFIINLIPIEFTLFIICFTLVPFGKKISERIDYFKEVNSEFDDLVYNEEEE